MLNTWNRAPYALSILVVDDDPDAAESLDLLLTIEGHRVQVAVDGPSALEAAEISQPDVVLLDLGLPRMDGYEVAEKLRQRKLPKKPLLIAISGRGEKAERLRSYEVGIDLHWTKPVMPDELLALLRRYQTIIRPAKACIQSPEKPGMKLEAMTSNGLEKLAQG
jgi:CheY-like chemotaxis protein